MNINSIQKNLQNILANDFPVSIEIDGTTYTGSFISQKIEKTYSKYGVSNDYSTSVIVSKSDVINTPEVKTKIKVDGDDFRIIGVEPSPASFVLDLEKIKT